MLESPPCDRMVVLLGVGSDEPLDLSCHLPLRFTIPPPPRLPLSGLDHESPEKRGGRDARTTEPELGQARVIRAPGTGRSPASEHPSSSATVGRGAASARPAGERSTPDRAPWGRAGRREPASLPRVRPHGQEPYARRVLPRGETFNDKRIRFALAGRLEELRPPGRRDRTRTRVNPSPRREQNLAHYMRGAGDRDHPGTVRHVPTTESSPSRSQGPRAKQLRGHGGL